MHALMRMPIGWSVDARSAALARLIWVAMAAPRLGVLPMIDLAFAWPMRLVLAAVAYGLAGALALGHRTRGVSLLFVFVLGALGGRSSALLDGSDRWLRATVLFLPFCELAAAWSREVAKGERPASLTTVGSPASLTPATAARPARARVPLLPLVALVLAGALTSMHLYASRLPAALPVAATLALAAVLALPARAFDRLRQLPSASSTETAPPRTPRTIALLLIAQLAIYAWGIAAAHGLVALPGPLLDELGLLGIQP